MPEKKQSSTRDENGVRKQEYKRFKQGRDYEPVGDTQTIALCDMMRRGFFGIEETAEGGEVQRKPGRPRKIETVEAFTEIVEKYISYIEEQAKKGVRLIPDIEGFCCFAGISRDTLNDWERTRPGEYSDTIKRFKNAVASYKKQLALDGKIPPLVFATDFNNNHGYVQQTKIDIQPTKPLEGLPQREDIIKKVSTGRIEEIEQGEDLEELLK